MYKMGYLSILKNNLKQCFPKMEILERFQWYYINVITRIIESYSRMTAIQLLSHKYITS